MGQFQFLAYTQPQQKVFCVWWGKNLFSFFQIESLAVSFFLASSVWILFYRIPCNDLTLTSQIWVYLFTGFTRQGHELYRETWILVVSNFMLHLIIVICLEIPKIKKKKSGREPWSSGNGRRVTSKRSWVRILAPNSGWTFFHIDLL